MSTPTTLDEAVDYLIAHMNQADQNAFAAGAPAPHFSLGMSLRNEWSLWGNESALVKWFQSNDIHHGDDRSQTIFEALRAKLKGEPFDVAAQAARYKAYWDRALSNDRHAIQVLRVKRGGQTEVVHPGDPDYPKDLQP